jgi:ABC-type transporter Mla subunit MlaD
MNALIQASQLSIDFTIGGEDISQIEDNLDGVKEFYTTLSTVEGQITEFQQAVAALPRMTTKLNRSKKAVVNVLQQLINALQSGQAMAQEAEKSLIQIISSN